MLLGGEWWPPFLVESLVVLKMNLKEVCSIMVGEIIFELMVYSRSMKEDISIMIGQKGNIQNNIKGFDSKYH